MDKDKDENKDEGVPLVCPLCGWNWIYKGEMVKATCPSCGRKVKAREIDGSEEG